MCSSSAIESRLSRPWSDCQLNTVSAQPVFVQECLTRESTLSSRTAFMPGLQRHCRRHVVDVWGPHVWEIGIVEDWVAAHTGLHESAVATTGSVEHRSRTGGMPRRVACLRSASTAKRRGSLESASITLIGHHVIRPEPHSGVVEADASIWRHGSFVDERVDTFPAQKALRRPDALDHQRAGQQA